MKYKILENNVSDLNNIQESILLNRGIINPKQYLNCERENIQSYKYLKNIDNAIKLLNIHIEKKNLIVIIVDEDCDGWISSSILYSFLKKSYKDINIHYMFHTKSKAHGISDDILENLPKEARLLIVPDAGTANEKECLELSKKGIDVLIIDHHPLSDNKIEHAIIINPYNSSDYENTQISGSGVVWQFINALDDENWNSYSDDYFDMIALSIISDSCDIRTYENRTFLNIGLNNIKNKLLLALIEKQSFYLKEITPIGLSFSIIPLINAVVRSGSMEEKELMFRAFCEIDEFTDYQKRDKTIIQESIYDKVSRLAVNAKSRQDRAIEKSLEIIEEDIINNNRNKNKILFALADDRTDKAFSGLCAMKLASKYSKPVALLRDNGKDYFSGSIRNFSGCSLTDLKGFLLSLNSVAWISGHNNAAGIGLTKKQLIRTINLSNEKLADYDFSQIYFVDLECDYENLSIINNKMLSDIYELRHYYGQNISETLILLKNIKVNSSDISFIGKEKKDSWKFSLSENNNIEVIKFKFDENDTISDRFQDKDFSWESQDIVLDLIVKISKNEYNGNSSWSFIVQDYELVE